MGNLTRISAGSRCAGAWLVAAIVAFVALLLLAIPSSAGGGGPSPDAFSASSGGTVPGPALTVLTVEGTGTRSVSYDGAVGRFSIQVLRDSIVTAVSDGNAAVAQIAAAVEANCTAAAPPDADVSSAPACVSPNGLQTVGIRIQEEFDYTDQGRVSQGFRYENRLSIAINGTGFAGGLVDLVIRAGGDAVRFEGLDFTTSRRGELERLALLDAIDNARLTADAIGRHMGYQIVRIASLTPRESFVVESSRDAVPAAAAGGDFVPTDVFAGQAVITSRVSLTFELRPL